MNVMERKTPKPFSSQPNPSPKFMPKPYLVAFFLNFFYFYVIKPEPQDGRTCNELRMRVTACPKRGVLFTELTLETLFTAMTFKGLVRGI